MAAPQLQTARLNLRRWQSADLELLAEICSDPEVMGFVGSGTLWPRERCQEFIDQNERSFEQTGFCQWAVEVRETAALIGFCGFVPYGEDVEIGWRIGRPFQRQGFAVEASRAVIDAAGSAGIRKIFATIQSENEASSQLAARLGMTQVDSFLRNGRETLLFLLRLEPAEQTG